MSANPLLAPLSCVRIFQGLSTAQLEAIARHAERIVYRPGEIITAAGADADAAVLIVGGASERIIEGMPSHVEPVQAGSLVGEMAMFIDHVYGATIRAKGSVRALRITRSGMHRQMLDDASLADHCVRMISARLSDVAAELRRIDTSLAYPIEATTLAASRVEASGPSLLIPVH